MKAAFRTALALSLTLFAAASLEAADIDTPDESAIENVRIVNNYNAMVRVYAEDSEGRLHKLGRVGSGELVEFEIPEAMTDGAFRIKIYPGQPVWSLDLDDYGVKTNPLNLTGEEDVTVWVEPELTDTVVEMSRG